MRLSLGLVGWGRGVIQYFPGHMQRARRQIGEALQRVDVVIEILDARMPQGSSNPLLDELCANKPRLRLLNKADLADPQVTQAWCRVLRGATGGNTAVMAVNALRPADLRRIPSSCRRLAAQRTQRGGGITAMVVGIPNIGKSTVLNTLAGRRVARVGNEPGVTRAQQLIHQGSGLRMLDTPGVLWPKFADQDAACRLAILGALRETAFAVGEVACFALDFLRRRYPEGLTQRFGVVPDEANSSQWLVHIGRRRGCLRAGGEVDVEQAAALLLRELRGGALGKVSLEFPTRDAAWVTEENPQVEEGASGSAIDGVP